MADVKPIFSVSPDLIGTVERRTFEPDEICPVFSVHPSQIGEVEFSRHYKREEMAVLFEIPNEKE